MAFTEEQKQQAIELFKKIATQKAYHKEYMKIYRQKLLEQGITQKCYNKKHNNTINCNKQYHKHTAFVAIKNLLKEMSIFMVLKMVLEFVFIESTIKD